ncbi:MAG: hypothetical protein K0B09_08815 [Bacteroidales bacterium]|nr:hypothetical protein [Bacteroidales bacterium]
MRTKSLITLAIILASVIVYTGCTHEDSTIGQNTPLNEQVRVQVAYDATNVAFKFTWKTQPKMYPEGQANVGKKYPGQFHEVLKHNGTAFDRYPSDARLQEDRITFMIDKYEGGIPGFSRAGCAVSCHTGMGSHHLLTDHVVDHWHWRGGRSGPMDYAEDAAINNVERIRDNLGTPPSKFVRSAGDRLREDQVAMTGTAHQILSDGFPRFVFNKGKTMPGNYQIPSFFLTNDANQVMTNALTDIPGVKDVKANRSLLVVYQDMNFDPIDKVNSLDLGYLVWVATSEVSHLPAHLQDVNSTDFTLWKNFWAAQSGITAAAGANTKLNEVRQEWIASGNNAMVSRIVGFIYNSDQHDITSERSFDANRNEWTVILKRRLNTGSNRDADLSGLPNGTAYTMSFAMHDTGAGSETHDISLPYVVSKDAGTDIQAKSVSDIENVDWSTVPIFDTRWVKQSVMNHFHYDWLKSNAHPGAGVLETSKCVSCHGNSLYTVSVLN